MRWIRETEVGEAEGIGDERIRGSGRVASRVGGRVGNRVGEIAREVGVTSSPGNTLEIGVARVSETGGWQAERNKSTAGNRSKQRRRIGYPGEGRDDSEGEKPGSFHCRRAVWISFRRKGSLSTTAASCKVLRA
jgi:hypothetical protein